MRALILVDLQKDFLPGGALAVPRGDEVIAVANRLMSQFDLIVATLDWHPADHLSFASQHAGRRTGDVVTLAGLEQILWPDHCVAGTPGAELVTELERERIDQMIYKGTERELDSYSGFFDNARRKGTGLEPYLRERGVDEVSIMGLATDYCVKFTALDAVELGFKTTVLLEGCRGVELQPGDCADAVAQLRAAGVHIEE